MVLKELFVTVSNLVAGVVVLKEHIFSSFFFGGSI